MPQQGHTSYVVPLDRLANSIHLLSKKQKAEISSALNRRRGLGKV